MKFTALWSKVNLPGKGRSTAASRGGRAGGEAVERAVPAHRSPGSLGAPPRVCWAQPFQGARRLMRWQRHQLLLSLSTSCNWEHWLCWTDIPSLYLCGFRNFREPSFLHEENQPSFILSPKSNKSKVAQLVITPWLWGLAALRQKQLD